MAGLWLLTLLLSARAQSDMARRASWREIAPLPEPRWFHASGVDAKGHVYAFGGNVLRAGRQERGLDEDALVYFDPAQQRWLRAPAPPSFRRTLLEFHTSDGVRIPTTRQSPYGLGSAYELPVGTSDARRVYWFNFLGPVRFEAANGEWSQPADAVFVMDEHRYAGPVPAYRRMGGATAVDLQGRLWVAGGWGRPEGREPPRMGGEPGGFESRVLTSLEVYDPAANTYAEMAPMPSPRWLFAASFGADGKLYVFGGCAAASFYHHENGDPEDERKEAEWSRSMREALRTVDAYDPATDTWSSRAPMPEPRQNMAAALGADGKIYVIGGIRSYADTRAHRSVFVYDPARDVWSEGPSLRTERQGHTAVASKSGRIYAIGGTNAYATFRLVTLIGGPPGEAGSPLDSVEVLETRAAPAALAADRASEAVR